MKIVKKEKNGKKIAGVSGVDQVKDIFFVNTEEAAIERLAGV